MQFEQAIRAAVDLLCRGSSPESVDQALAAEGYAGAPPLGELCATALREAEQRKPKDLVHQLLKHGASPVLAETIVAEVCSGESPLLVLGRIEGVPVLQLQGDLGLLPPDRLAELRPGLLEPLWVEDCRLLLDVGALCEAPLGLWGELVADVDWIRQAGGELLVTGAGEEVRALLGEGRVDEVLELEPDPAAALRRLGALAPRPVSAQRFAMYRGEGRTQGQSLPILAPRGSFDRRSGPRAARKVRQVLAGAPRAVLDCAEVPWLDEVGLALLGELKQEAAERGALELANLRGPARVAAEAAGLWEGLAPRPSRAAALARAAAAS